jgi:predicted small metal-binding protein
MKSFKCGSLVPGCDWHTRNDDEAEVVRRAVDHLKSAHGEDKVRPEMVERIKERIKDEAASAA